MSNSTNNTRDNILRVTRELITQKPYHTVSLNMIARQAGVTKPSLYYYFQDKQDLFLKLFDKVSREFDHKLDEVLQKDLSPHQRLRLFIETYIDFFFDQKHLIKILMQWISRQDKRLCNKLKKTREGIIKKLEEIMAEVLKQNKRDKDISPRMASMMLLGMLGTFYVEHVEEKKEFHASPGQVADQIISFLGFKNKL